MSSREYKSDVFSMLMAMPEYALNVYNALNGTNYYESDELIYQELDRGISLTIRNDASFIVDSSLSLYEHQSTYNPNMPLRNLIYISRILEDYVKQQKGNLFGSTRIPLPLPHFVCFYNGVRERPEVEEMKLSESYSKFSENPELELCCKVYNINAGNNDEFLGKCSVLRDYMKFVDFVRLNLQYMELHEAISEAVDRCINENILRDFFSRNREEVVQMAALDYTFEKRLEYERRDGLVEGEKLGLEKGEKLGLEKGEKLGIVKGALMFKYNDLPLEVLVQLDRIVNQYDKEQLLRTIKESETLIDFMERLSVLDE